MWLYPKRAVIQREQQHEGRRVERRGQVKPGPALTPGKIHWAGTVALCPVIHPKPPLILLCPLV